MDNFLNKNAQIWQFDNKVAVKHWQQLQNYVPYFWGRASNDFGASRYGIQTIKIGFNYFWTFVTFQYRGLHHLELHSTYIIEAWLKSSLHFDCRYLQLWNACIINLVFIVLNVRDRTEPKYPSIVFLSIVTYILKVMWTFKNISEILHDLNDSDEQTRMLKTASENSNRVNSYVSFKIMQISI